MTINHDKTYCNDKDLVVHGYAAEDLYSIRFSYEYTDEEKKANSDAILSLSREAWDKHCEEAFLTRNDVMFPIIDTLSKAFRLYQYSCTDKYVYKSVEWDFLFWCNNYEKRGVRDYSYFTLTFNEYMTPEQRSDLCKRILEFVTANFSDCEHLKVMVQYRIRTFKEKIADNAQAVIPHLVGRHVSFMGMDGKVVQTELGVFFVKKRARTRGYQLSNTDILRMSCEFSVE